MAIDVDCVVIGGGVAGLMTAVRLAEAGKRVRLCERDRIGAGATTSNHGLIHSGALYARWHPEIVATCAQAQTAYRSSFPESVVAAESCWYYASPRTLHNYRSLWDRHDIVNRRVDPRRIGEILQTGGREVGVCAVAELVIDTHTLLAALTARCAALGVEISTGATVARIVTDGGRVAGVETGAGLVRASRVVLCAGIGTRNLLDGAGSRIGAELASRLEMLTAYPGTLARPLIGLEFGWPALAPTGTGAVLASRYGGQQRTVTGPGRWPVPTSDAAALDTELAEWLTPGVIEHGTAHAWVCSKTEHLRQDADQWGTAPNYTVIDHAARGELYGLWTVLPGKMTLAMHASRDVAAAITGTPQPLHLRSDGPTATTEVAGLVATQPWVTEQVMTR